MHSFLVWLQRNLAWSNSRQSWEERLGIFALLGGGLLIWLLGGQLSVLQQVVLWGGLILLAAILLRRGWLKLFGPVLFYDMVRMARRNRFIWMRMAYAGLLCFFLFVTASNTYYGYGLTPVQAASRVAMNYFQTFMMVQLIVVLLITPAYVAGAVAEEKEKKTLEFLLATDLRNREIVLSKLVSRMCNLILFILTGLPILGFMQLLGGVDPNLVLTGFAATALTMMGLAGLSIYNSTQCKRARDAIALTYLEGFGYYAISLLAWTWQNVSASPILGWPLWFDDVPLIGWSWWTGQAAPTFSDFVAAFNSGNLILALIKIGQAAFTGTLGTTLPTLLRDYSLFQGVVFAVTVGWAVLRLRSVAIAQMSESKRVRHALAQAKLEATAARKGSDGYSGAELDKPPLPVRTSVFGRPPVGNLPMFWKELYAEGGIRFGVAGWLTVLLLVVLTFVPVIWIFSWYASTGGGWRRGDGLQEALNGWLRTCSCLIGSLTLLAVGIRAAGAISSEREKQTWDSLMTSPLDSDEILTAKWLGAIFSVRLSWVWLGSVWLLGLVTGAMHPLALPLVVAAWLVYSGVISLIGLHFSMVCQTTGRATVYTMLTLLGVSVGHWLPWMCCAFSPMNWGGRGIEMLAQFQAGLTPPFVLAFLSFRGADFAPNRPDEMTRLVLFCVIGLFIWTLVCVVAWIAISLNFRTLTHRDRLLRADVGYGPALRERRQLSSADEIQEDEEESGTG